VSRLQISLGAASQGLKLLKSFGVVKVVDAPGERRDHYVADLELSRFATAFLRDEVQPRMERASQRVARMEELAARSSPGESAVLEEKIARLRHWLDRGQSLTPFLLRFLAQ
jgi:DNA-binding transcriptional regulator GbsR (MarR family)